MSNHSAIPHDAKIETKININQPPGAYPLEELHISVGDFKAAAVGKDINRLFVYASKRLEPAELAEIDLMNTMPRVKEYHECDLDCAHRADIFKTIGRRMRVYFRLA